MGRVTRSRWRGIVALLALALVAVACGGGETQDEAGADDDATAAEAVPDTDAAGEMDEAEEEPAEESADEPAPDVFLSIATGGTGGAYFPFGGALASLLSREIPHVTATAEATGASVENLRLLEQGNVDLAHVQADALFSAYHGTGPFDGGPIEARTIIAKYPNYMQLVALADSGIQTVDDLEGRRVSVGDAGSGVELSLTAILDALGRSFDDFGDVVQFGYNDQTSAFRNNQIDVGNYQGALGLSAITDLSSTTAIQILSFTEEQIATITTELPYHSGGLVPADTYPGVDAEVLVPALWNFVAVSADMDRELVYLMTKTAYENQDSLIAGHPEAASTTLDNVTQAVVPYHPGAIDYFLEAGVDLPEDLYPDEWDG
ncbi:TAXI family TRAP transporter solute-binding subunit [soil metagenome]